MDVSADSNRTMTSADGRRVMVYDGELYDFRGLRRDLESGGAAFRTSSDGEVFLEAWAAHGPGAVERCHGMFAPALWARCSRKLGLVRDHLGIKPPSLRPDTGRLVFDSEIEAIRAARDVSHAVDPSGLREDLEFGNARGERTLSRSIREPAPDTIASFNPSGKRRDRTYWSASTLPQANPAQAGAVEAIRSTLTAAVRCHVVSDVQSPHSCPGGSTRALSSRWQRGRAVLRSRPSLPGSTVNPTRTRFRPNAESPRNSVSSITKSGSRRAVYAM